MDLVKIRRSKKVLHAGTETEAIERALDLAISEHERNRLAAEANERFMKSRIAFNDVYGTPEQSMQLVLFDRSICITALRMGDDAALGLGRVAGGAAVW
jgi:hypothetical protein